MFLKDEFQSRLGVFYDNVQNLRDENFGNAFMIETPPFLLKENIRNTANIYNWATKHTELGNDVIVNPVEGPNPKREYINGIRHFEQRIENLLREFLVKEELDSSSLVILADDLSPFQRMFDQGLASWKFVKEPSSSKSEIQFTSVYDFKGLEADMVIYVHRDNNDLNVDYTAYTRAKYYLHELIIR
jgi:DNA helicase IV